VNRNEDSSLQEFNHVTRRKNEDIRRETLEKVDKLKEAGYCVRSIKECEWKMMKKRPEISNYLKTLRCVRPRFQLSFQKF